MRLLPCSPEEAVGTSLIKWACASITVRMGAGIAVAAVLIRQKQNDILVRARERMRQRLVLEASHHGAPESVPRVLRQLPEGRAWLPHELVLEESDILAFDAYLRPRLQLLADAEAQFDAANLMSETPVLQAIQMRAEAEYRRYRTQVWPADQRLSQLQQQLGLTLWLRALQWGRLAAKSMEVGLFRRVSPPHHTRPGPPTAISRA